MTASPHLGKRKTDETKDRGGENNAIKKRKKVKDHTPGLKLGLGPSIPREPPRRRQDSKDYTSSLFIGPDSRDVAPLDFRTALDSVPVDPPSATPQWQTEGKEGDRNRSENILESSQASTSPPINQLSVDLILERRVSSNDPFVLPPGPSTEIPNTTLHGSHSHEDGWPSMSHRDIHFLIPSTQTLDARCSLPIPTGLVNHPPDQGPVGIPHDPFIVPSSQSQYLLPYNASPPQSPHCDSEGKCFSPNRTEIFPSSQTHLEMDLQIPTPRRCGNAPMVKDDDVDPPVASITGERTPVLTRYTSRLTASIQALTS